MGEGEGSAGIEVGLKTLPTSLFNIVLQTKIENEEKGEHENNQATRIGSGRKMRRRKEDRRRQTSSSPS